MPLRRFPPRTTIAVSIHVLAVGIILALVITAVLHGVHHSLLRQWLASTVVMWAALTAYFTVLLWIGVRPDNGYVRWREKLESLQTRMSKAPLGDGRDVLDIFNFGGFGDVFELILGVVFGIFLSFFGVILFWIGVNFVVIAVMLLSLPIYFVFRRGLRLVLVESSRCHHHLGRSVFIATRYAAGYALCIGVPLWLADYLIHFL